MSDYFYSRKSSSSLGSDETLAPSINARNHRP